MGRPKKLTSAQRLENSKKCGQSWRRKYPARYLVYMARGRARRTGREFNLTEEDIVVPEFCPILGIRLHFEDPKRNESPSLDRIDNSRGYTKDNVMVISNKANKMKGDATLSELKAFSKWIDGL